MFKFALLSTVFNIKYFYAIKLKLHNLFEHNTDYLMSCPTGVLLLHVLQQLKLA